MEKLLFFLCLCLALAALPGSPHAEELSITKPGRIVTTSILGASFGVMIGAIVAGFSGSYSGAPVLIGGAAGFVLGFAFAAMTSTWEAEEASHGSAENTGAGASSPCAAPADDPGPGADAFR